MRLIIFTGLVAMMILSVSGCATTDNSLAGDASSDVAILNRRIRSLETELKESRQENLSLKEKITELQKIIDEKIIVKMPTGKEIQAALKNAGLFKGEVDGKIGPKTKESIRKFQENNKLNADGAVGSKTWEKLKKYLDVEQTTTKEETEPTP
jgi:peptidoglycan hydrolase-like protein with peptidoglycan-binding domain